MHKQYELQLLTNEKVSFLFEVHFACSFKDSVKLHIIIRFCKQVDFEKCNPKFQKLSEKVRLM
ncbi:MAG: hypothetical protein EZS28_056127, partial [Streblomastix strix]